MKTLTPALFLCLKDYSKDKFVKDLISGIIVAIIALPLSIALALASGVTPEQGLYTAIVAGFVISFFGGSSVQIAGPTAAFATIVAGVVAKSGMEGLVVATVIAGILLILLDLLRGKLMKNLMVVLPVVVLLVYHIALLLPFNLELLDPDFTTPLTKILSTAYFFLLAVSLSRKSDPEAEDAA